MQNNTWLTIFLIKDVSERSSDIFRWLAEITAFKRAEWMQIVVLREFVEIGPLSPTGERDVSYRVEHFSIENRRQVAVDAPAIDRNKKDSLMQLLSWTLANFKADRRVMVTMSHGAAFAILDSKFMGMVRDFRDLLGKRKNTRSHQPPKLKVIEPKFIVVKSLPAERLKDPKHFMNLTKADLGKNKELVVEIGPDFDCDKLRVLWIAELGLTISEGLGEGNKIDLMIMNNCYTQSFDSGYTLKDCVENYLAPETTMVAFAYDIIKMFQEIQRDRSIDGLELANEVIRAFKESNTGPGNYTALFNCRLPEYKSFLPLFNNVVECLIGIEPHVLKPIIIETLTRKVVQIDGSGSQLNSLFDVITVFEEISAAVNETKLTSAVRLLRTFLTTHLISCPHHIGQGIILADKNEDGRAMKPNGVSFCFPPSRKVLVTQKFLLCSYWGENIVKSPLVAKSKWDEFLEMIK